MHARHSLYGYTAMTPAMAMRVTGIGSQYLMRSPKSRLVTLFEVLFVH
jgi:hypothetical protein